MTEPSLPQILGGVPEGYVSHVLATLAQTYGRCIYIARDDRQMEMIRRGLGFFAPTLKSQIACLPAWDCLPYDRLSPQTQIMATRMATLVRLPQLAGTPHIVLTTAAAAIQRIPTPEIVARTRFQAQPGQTIASDTLVKFLIENGYHRCTNVTEAGDFAVRGGIIDLYPPDLDAPLRLDLFGATLESIRSFAPETQRSTAQVASLDLVAAGEVHLDSETIARFRKNYLIQFGRPKDSDPLYEAICSGAHHLGFEHYLPLFYESLATIFDHCGTEALYIIDSQADDARMARLTQVEDYHDARVSARARDNHSGLKPLPPEALYVLESEWEEYVTRFSLRRMGARVSEDCHDFGGRIGYNFAPARTAVQSAVQSDRRGHLFDTVVKHIDTLRGEGKQVVLTSSSEGSAERLLDVLHEHGLKNDQRISDWGDMATASDVVGVAVLDLPQGFETPTTAFLSEQDILGQRMARVRMRKRAANHLTETTSLSIGDYIVHIDHGVGRFEGLETLDVGGAPHDCLVLAYAQNTRLFLPVENIDLLNRYGGDSMTVKLDRLGGAAWQERKARLKGRLRDIADGLIRVAAARALREGARLVPDTAMYDEFCTRFPHDETDDQLEAIAATLSDMARGRPMDRLICGDVGFGKTEVALRAAFIAATEGYQTALIVPTTLLARQHTVQFRMRFEGFPIKIAELSRLVPPQTARTIRASLADGTIDIIIGTHALLANSISFKRLGLVIVDEEQHFGVTHKERLKKLRHEVHMLTLTATPIPRTLQLAMAGVRDMSLIATPPIDRLAVRSFISPFDPVMIREALLREKYRGGQSFFIVPRIADIAENVEFLQNQTPELRVIVVHGRLASRDLEERMTAFYDGKSDVLLSTSIIESGLDIPAANTIVIHRADMFGLAQLYQIRGRVGRSRLRAFAYMTYDSKKPLTPAAEKRLNILQSLDSLGGGFTLASHDLDMRGAGNLVGDEQSGHIREVGFELYQSMLEEAVAEQQGQTYEQGWSPQINSGLSVLIPAHYVPDLDVRMGLYRRCATLTREAEIDAFAAELADRFGPIPPETHNLLKTISTKILCLRGGISKIEGGENAMSIRFHKHQFAHPEGLVIWMNDEVNNGRQIKMRSDHTLVVGYNRKPDSAPERLAALSELATKLAQIAENTEKSNR